LLMKNGEIECNSKFIFRNLQTKLLEARPDILSVAASQFNLCIFNFLKILISTLVQHKP
jgi:hypothetical protein